MKFSDERLSSFRIGNLLSPSSFHFKIHATDSSHKQYFAFVPSGIDTTEIYKEIGPNASRLKTGKSTGDKNVLIYLFFTEQSSWGGDRRAKTGVPSAAVLLPVCRISCF